MSISQLSNSQLKTHYTSIFAQYNASDSEDSFKQYLQHIVNELAWNLDVNLDLLNKDLSDPVVCKARSLGALESLSRVLLNIAEAANYKATRHPDWSLLAGRIEMIRLKLMTPETMHDVIERDPSIWRRDPECDYYQFFHDHCEELEAMIVPERDFDFYFFGVRTLEKSYLLRYISEGDSFLETPQRMYLRIATFLHMPNLEAIKDYYDDMSTGKFIHSSPTIFHSGIRKGSLASCFLLSMQDDLKKIFTCLGQCAEISKAAGGIGLDITNIRHSKVGHLGQSSGIVPMLKVYDSAMRYVDQAGRRKGSATIFLQPWHIDFPDFLQLKRQQGSEERRARDLFYSVWSCDLFMDRVTANEKWTLFCPKYAPMLKDTYGEEFEEWYLKYEAELPGKPGSEHYCKVVNARDLWTELLTTQIEAGMPFITHKDTANYTSNQKNLGLIRSSNLCQEISEVTDETTISSCNLASIALDEFVKDIDGKQVYDFDALGVCVRKVIRGLNNVIDRTYYPLQEDNGEPGPIKSTNLRYRPLGLGVQALADTFLKLGLAWTDTEAKELNRQIFATMYYHAVSESVELAKEFGSYDGFDGSPASEGLLKPHLLAHERARKILRKRGVKSSDPQYEEESEKLVKEILAEKLTSEHDWESLVESVKEHGLRNSLLIALMPTASSAQIRYKNESFEPFTSNMYVRSVLSGNHLVINRYMVKEFEELGMWNNSIINFIMKNDGSIATLPLELAGGDPEKTQKLQRLKEKCQTAYELSQKLLVDMSVDRAYYVCQSQSLNIHKKDPTFKMLTALHMRAWEEGLTTGMYYLRSAPATEAIKFTVDGDLDAERTTVCTDEVCISCQS